jgi:DNA-binding response OmpR family regulator
VVRHTVLVVEDEPQIAEIARDYLMRAGYGVLTAADGRTALDLARERRPSLVVLDLNLPELSGFDVARALRRESDVPIVMLTARVDESDRLRGLDIGADDYITKPFSPRELVARVKAVLRRSDAAVGAGDMITVADLVIDATRLTVTRAGQEVPLTVTEFQLLSAFARQPGRVFTRGQLLDAVRGTEVDSYERAIDTHIKNIRRKLEPDTRHPRYVLSVYGIGYKFRDG